MEYLTDFVDSSFKYILLGFNLLTLVVVYIHKKKMVVNKQHHILFVFAHPDDEAMFFGPTINDLKVHYFIHFLCLCHGNSHRAEELAQSARYFGIHQHKVVHDQRMIDGMKSKWDQQAIRDTVKEYVTENNIKAIFTFDQHGVSEHLNHRTVYHALSRLEVLDEQKKPQAEKGENPANETKSIKIYYLETVNIIRKYTGLLQLLIYPFKEFSFLRFNYFHGYNSMALHKSQFVWYRKLFVLFSRYTYINTFKMRKIKFQE